MRARDIGFILSLVGGTLITIVVPVAVTGWVAYRAVRSGHWTLMLLQCVLVAVQAAAILNAYRVERARAWAALLPLAVAGLQLAVDSGLR